MAGCRMLLLLVLSAFIPDSVSQEMQVPMHVKRIGNDVGWTQHLREGLPYSNTTFLLKDVIMSEGLLFAYSAYFLSSQPIRFQVWRPVDLSQNRFQLMWETRIKPEKWSTRVDTYIRDLPDAKCVPVQNDDRLGIFIEGIPSSVSYTFNGHNPRALTHPLVSGETFARINDVISFDALMFPYDYAVAAYIDTDIRGSSRLECPQGRPKLSPTRISSMGPTDPIDALGDIRATGLPVKPATNRVYLEQPSCYGNWLLLLLVAWLAGLSVLNVLYICYVCCVKTSTSTKQEKPRCTHHVASYVIDDVMDSAKASQTESPPVTSPPTPISDKKFEYDY